MPTSIDVQLARYVADGWQIVSRTDREIILARHGSLFRRGRTLRLVVDKQGRLRPVDDTPRWAKALGAVAAGFVMLWALASPNASQPQQDGNTASETRFPAPKPTSAPNYDTLSNAWEACQIYVRQRLRAPSTAKFPWVWDVGSQHVKADDGSTRWILSAHVTAENDFGARRRVDFFCTVRHTGNNRWELEALSMGDPH